MQVRATEQALYEEIGRLYIANTAMGHRIGELFTENARLRNDVDKLASQLPDEAVVQDPTKTPAE